MKQKIHLGFLGAGSWGRSKHLPAIAYIQKYFSDRFDLEISALCERDAGVADAVSREYGIETVYDNVDDFARDERLNCYAVVIDPRELPGALGKISHRGVPFLTEKPPGLTSRDAQHLSETVEVPNVVAFNRRYFPILQQFKDMLDEVDLYYIDCNFYRYERYDSKNFRESHGRRGSPFVIGTGVHGINLLEYLFGNIEQSDATVIEVRTNDTEAWLADLVFASGLKGRLKILPCSGSQTEWIEAHSQKRSIYIHLGMYSQIDYPGAIYVHEDGKLKYLVEGDASLPRLVNEGFVNEYLELFGLLAEDGSARSTLQTSVNCMRVAESIEGVLRLE